MQRHDFLRNDVNGDMKVENGDFVIGASDQNHQERILIASPGTYKFSPLVGAMLSNSINATDDLDARNALLKKIRLQLEMDGYKINTLKMDQGNISIAADPTN
jgi:hypothetical protein